MLVMWLIQIPHKCVWRDSFVCDTWLIHACDVTHPDSLQIRVTWLIRVWGIQMCVAWLTSINCIHVWNVTPSCVWHDSSRFFADACDVTRSCVRHTNRCHMTHYNTLHSCVKRDSFMRVTWLIQIPHSCVWRDSFISLADICAVHLWWPHVWLCDLVTCHIAICIWQSLGHISSLCVWLCDHMAMCYAYGYVTKSHVTKSHSQTCGHIAICICIWLCDMHMAMWPSHMLGQTWDLRDRLCDLAPMVTTYVTGLCDLHMWSP